MAEPADEADDAPRGPHGLRGWFGKLRRRRWATLFVFEFFVVLLGVLAAQGLQSWFQAQQERRDAVAAKATLDRTLRSIALSAELRLRGLACHGDRLNRIARALRDGMPYADTLRAPEEALVLDLGWSGRTPAAIAEHFGQRLAETYDNAALWVDALQRAQAREQESWADLARISPKLGPATATDISVAKGAFVDASRDLLHVSWAAGHLRRHARDLKLDPDVSELAAYRRNADRCKRALSYPVEAHQRAAAQGRLVTGETRAPSF